MEDETLTLTFNRIEGEQAAALALFAKRLMFNDIRAKAVSDEEAYTMRDALEKLQTALEDAGYPAR